ncbi:MAG: OsmC family protein [Candidatus Marinimicrobia bacterium]|nr:OsmC family protein [Candidatus Neomarinimicrobiota bacterium]MCF7850792.1 OsmC family protein [Candidatus Neomarinimicrobiota bacterium]MCF7904798.1 OsmC family protein [Candidatus Neomarinimicrobiota bacterium]
MADIKIKQVQGATFAARGKTNHWTMMDGEEQFGGAGAASKPTELVLFGLGGCTAMDVVSILKKMRVAVDDFQIGIDFERAEDHPKVFTKIDMTYHFYGTDLPMAKLEKAVSLSKDRYCTVSAMLSKAVDISVNIEVHEPE